MAQAQAKVESLNELQAAKQQELESLNMQIAENSDLLADYDAALADELAEFQAIEEAIRRREEAAAAGSQTAAPETRPEASEPEETEPVTEAPAETDAPGGEPSETGGTETVPIETDPPRRSPLKPILPRRSLRPHPQALSGRFPAAAGFPPATATGTTPSQARRTGP